MSDHLSWTSHLLRAFYAEGIRHIYISPGSRSTPLVLASAIHSGFEKHVVLDERSASFQALGSAKASGIPALLICTSGTALAHYHPAVIEAKHSGVPMIILSADRPPYLRGTGSSQTIDQLKIFGDSVVMFHEAGEPVHNTQDYKRLSLLAKQAVTRSITEAGPVHINLPFRKPLEPSNESLNIEEAENKNQVSDQKSNTKSVFKTPVNETRGADLITVINKSRKPLIIAGPDESWRALKQVAYALASKMNVPLIAEPGSHLDSSRNIIDRYDILLNSNELKELLKPDLIIRIGDRPFSKSLKVFESGNTETPVVQMLSRNTHQDIIGPSKYRIILRNNELNLDNLERKKGIWIKKWHTFNTRAEILLKDTLQQTSALTDGHVYHFFSKHFVSDWDVISSNSFTVRDLALFTPRSCGISGTFVNRGAAGIDGILSTGIGMNRATRKWTAVFIGDLALLHDSNSLLSLNNPEQSVLIIVINNKGGNIFRMLPVYEKTKYYMKYFETPQKTDLADLAKAHSIPYLLIDSREKLLNTDVSELNTGRSLLIECRTDPESSMKLRNLLWNSNLADD